MINRDSWVYVHINGHDLYVAPLWMPQVPRKGDVLWLGSLTRGATEGDVQVSRVEWAMDQMTGTITAWLKVRRLPKAKP